MSEYGSLVGMVASVVLVDSQGVEVMQLGWSVKCPVCGAAVGESCRSMNARFASVSRLIPLTHRGRVEAESHVHRWLVSRNGLGECACGESRQFETRVNLDLVATASMHPQDWRDWTANYRAALSLSPVIAANHLPR